MASRMIGRATCPECGFGSAHVKQSEKCHYRYCPECSAQYYAKSERQVADLLAKTRIEAPGSGATPTGSAPAPIPADSAAPAAPAAPIAPAAPAAARRPGLGLGKLFD